MVALRLERVGQTHRSLRSQGAERIPFALRQFYQDAFSWVYQQIMLIHRHAVDGIGLKGETTGPSPMTRILSSATGCLDYHVPRCGHSVFLVCVAPPGRTQNQPQRTRPRTIPARCANSKQGRLLNMHIPYRDYSHTDIVIVIPTSGMSAGAAA